MTNLTHKRTVRFALLLAVVTVLGGSLSACNTTEGVGKDVKSTGQAIENTADKNK